MWLSISDFWRSPGLIPTRRPGTFAHNIVPSLPMCKPSWLDPSAGDNKCSSVWTHPSSTLIGSGIPTEVWQVSHYISVTYPFPVSINAYLLSFHFHCWSFIFSVVGILCIFNLTLSKGSVLSILMKCMYGSNRMTFMGTNLTIALLSPVFLESVLTTIRAKSIVNAWYGQYYMGNI